MIQSNYEIEREKLKSGDLIAFGGRGIASSIIKMKTHSNVSHVGVILETTVDWCDRAVVQIMESTSLGDGFAGVQINKMSTRVAQYTGDIWILPMLSDVWDMFGLRDYITWVICSELVSAGLQEGGAIPKALNASEETPIQTCRHRVWDAPIQIKGEESELS